MSYMDPQNPIGVPRSWHERRLSGVGTMGKRSVTLDADAFEKAHFTVIQQLHLITPFSNEWGHYLLLQDTKEWISMDTCSTL
jgi:hypothetical protein